MLIQNLLADTAMYATSCVANQPSNSRWIVLVNKVNHFFSAHLAYWNGQKWVDTSGRFLDITDEAVWMECPYYIDNKQEEYDMPQRGI